MGELELGNLSVYSMRVNTPEAWDSYLQGQVIEHGYMDWRTSPGMWPQACVRVLGVS
jgi:hypothetical protein